MRKVPRGHANNFFIVNSSTSNPYQLIILKKTKYDNPLL